MRETHLAAVLRRAVQLVCAPAGDDRPDAQLLRDYLAAGDPGDFAVIVRRHGPLVWRVCRRVLGDHHDAEDAFQATFLLLARKAGTVRAGTHLAGYLHGMAYRVALTAKRAAARRRAREKRAAGREQPGPGWEVAWREVQTLLHEEIDRLPAKYREPFLLCCVEGMGRAEAARRLGLKEGTVWSRLAEARGRLQSRLARRGIDLSAALGAAALTTAGQAAPAGLEKVTIDAVVSGIVRSAGAAELARKVGATMLMTRVKLAAALLALGSVLAMGVGLAARPRAQEHQPGQERKAAAPASLAGGQKVGLDRDGDALPPGALLRIGTLRYRTGGTNQAVLSPDGKTLAAASGSGIDLIDLANGKRLTLRDTKVRNGFTTAASYLAFAAGGKELVSVTEGYNLRVWDVSTGRLLRQFGKNHEPQRGPGGIMPAATVAPGAPHWSGVWDAPDSRLLVASQNGRVEYLDPASGKVERGFPITVRLASVAPDGKRLVSLNGNEVILYDGQGKELRRFTHPDRILRATISHQGKLLVTVNAESQIRVWELDSGKERLALPKVEGGKDPHFSFVSVTEVSRDGKTLLAGTRDGQVLRWDLGSGKALERLKPHDSYLVTGLISHADGRTLVSVSWDQVVRRTDLATGETASSEDGFAGYAHVARSPVAPVAAVADGRGRLELWDTAAGKRLRLFQPSGPVVSGLCFSSGGKLLAVGQGDGAVVLWDPATGKERRRWRAGARSGNELSIWFAGMCFSADGKFLAASVRPSGTAVWDVATGKEVWRDGAVGKVAFSPDGRTLVFGGFDKQFRFLDAATGKVRFTVPVEGLNEYIDSIFFSPDGRTLATSHHGGTVYLRDPATGAARQRLRGFKEVAWDGSFSPDGKWLAAAGDQEVRVWEAATGAELMCFKGHEGRAMQAEFGPDGRTVLSSSFDLTALLWDLRPTPDRERKPDELWAELAGDPVGAYRALWALVDDPKSCCALLRRRMAPVKDSADAALVRRLLSQLDSEKFEQREAASRELAAMGELVEDTLRGALKEAESAEVRRRLKNLLGKLQGGPTADDLRHLRAVHALELCGTAEARQVLRALARGASGARLTKDAQSALARLEKR